MQGVIVEKYTNREMKIRKTRTQNIKIKNKKLTNFITVSRIEAYYHFGTAAGGRACRRRAAMQRSLLWAILSTL